MNENPQPDLQKRLAEMEILLAEAQAGKARAEAYLAAVKAKTETFAKPSDVDAVQGVAAQRAQTYHTIGKRVSSAQRRNAPQMGVLQRSQAAKIAMLAILVAIVAVFALIIVTAAL